MRQKKKWTDVWLILILLFPLGMVWVSVLQTKLTYKSYEQSVAYQHDLILAREHNSKMTSKIESLENRVSVLESQMELNDVLKNVKKNIRLLPGVGK